MNNTQTDKKGIKYQTQEIRLTQTHNSIERYFAGGFDPLHQLQSIADNPATKPTDQISALKAIMALVYAKPPTEAQLEVVADAPQYGEESRARLAELLAKVKGE